jgi:hypothetical protein
MEAKKGQYKDIILSIDEENCKCVDCGQENPTKASVNNGVILCEGCAAEHMQLGPTISFIRDLSDDFDEYLLNYFTLGGNSKFKRFLKEENVDSSLPINQKYLTKACDFYRINLKKKVQGNKLLEKNYENPNEIVENPENHFPEFENYMMKNVPEQDTTKMGQAKKVLKNIGSNLFSFGKKMYSGVKQGANIVVVKAQPATKQIGKGAVYMGHQIGGAYTSLKNKIVALNKKKIKNEEQEKKEEEKKEENVNNLDINNPINNAEEQPKEEEQKQNEIESGPGILLNQPLGNTQVQEQNSGQ